MIVSWDGMPDVKGWEDSRESAQGLFPSLYKKDKEGAWRMDVNVELYDRTSHRKMYQRGGKFQFLAMI